MSEGVRSCKLCGHKFWTDCAEICQECFDKEVRKIERREALVRLKDHKLKIELVPQPSWYMNLRNRLGRVAWDKIRYESYRDAGYRCSVCGLLRVTLFCHEVWSYDDDRHIQKLVGFTALCNLCHMVKHIGFAGIQAEDGKLNYNSLIKHFRRVNKCSYEDFELARHLAFQVWEDRSMYEWKIELGQYQSLLKGGDNGVA